MAEQNCKSINATLISLHSEEEIEFVLDLVRKMISNFKLVWIGAKRTSFGVHDFEWSNQESFNFSNWDIGEPRDSRMNKTGVAMLYDGKWAVLDIEPYNESQHQNLSSLVCEKKLIDG